MGPTRPRFCRLGLARLGSAQLGPAWCGPWMARLGSAWPGLAWLGSAWLGSAWAGSARPASEAGPEIGKIFPPPACSPRGGGSRRFSAQINAFSTKFVCNLLAGAGPCGPRPAHPPQTVWFPRGGKYSVLGRAWPPCGPVSDGSA